MHLWSVRQPCASLSVFFLFPPEMSYRDITTCWNLGSVYSITENTRNKSRQRGCPAGPSRPLNFPAGKFLPQVFVPGHFLCHFMMLKPWGQNTLLSAFKKIFFSGKDLIKKKWEKNASFPISNESLALLLGECFPQCASKCAIWTRASSITSQWTSCPWTRNDTGVCVCVCVCVCIQSL